MSNSGAVSKYSNSSHFLEEPAPLSELDSWVEACMRSRRRFTFTEVEVLKLLWDEGEDIRLREDSRFQLVVLPHQSGVPQWRLFMHTIANSALYELLLDECWDGKDLHTYLEQLDREAQSDYLHVFCLHDQRFLLSGDNQGVYSLSLSTDKGKQELTLEQKSIIERVAHQLLLVVVQYSNKPWSTASIMEELKGLSEESAVLDACVPAALENWLLTQQSWVRVGVDTWLPKDKIPSVEKRHRYAVLPVPSAGNSRNLAMPEIMNEQTLKWNTIQTVEELMDTEAQEFHFPNKSVRWRVALRTVHINEGIVPIPKQVTILYPHAHKLSSNIALAGVWFTDASEMTVWLDKEKQQLYGPDLQEQLAFIEAGTVLEMTFTMTSLVFRTYDVDQQVAEEEVRLVDLSDLAQRRSTALESYRSSLRAILTKYNFPLRYHELYEELCNRQQHMPNRATIRGVLSSSPEFVFLKSEGKWSLNAAISPEESEKSLRRTAMIAHHAEDHTSTPQQEPVSLSQMIAKNRQQLTVLRSIYSANDKVGPLY